MSYFKDVISFELHRGEYYDSVNRYSLYCQSALRFIFICLFWKSICRVYRSTAIWCKKSESIMRFIGEREGFLSVYLEMK